MRSHLQLEHAAAAASAAIAAFVAAAVAEIRICWQEHKCRRDTSRQGKEGTATTACPRRDVMHLCKQAACCFALLPGPAVQPVRAVPFSVESMGVQHGTAAAARLVLLPAAAC